MAAATSYGTFGIQGFPQQSYADFAAYPWQRIYRKGEGNQMKHEHVWIVEFQNEDQPGQWFVHGVTLYGPGKDGMSRSLSGTTR
ncbi:MAG: hypothetical protein OXC39_06380 [Candidatus Dadabacteria bacterium]|nr:hypothetical protein [Candidatus Dadabacteria bacterium]